ncbi:unnamed protein product [Durusdinium trenchii]|uniref:Uncharacterized protein n=1 Tax=Durusdinium trenchii TaxID=1381693 RepID=A0ABP0I5F4_9DINO
MYWMYQGVLFWMSYSCWAFLDRLSMYTSFFSPSPHAGSASLQLVGGEFHVLTTNLRGFQSPAVQFQAKVRLMQSIAWQHAFNTYKQMQPWMSDTMKLMLMREIICSVLYVEDQFSDPLFWRKVAKPLQVIGVVVHLTIPELPRAKAAEGTREPSPRKDVKGRQRRSRPIEEDLGPPYYATYEVDAVEFSQDSIAKRFTCGRFLEDTVDDLFTGKVEHLNTKAFPFMLLLAVKVGDRIISRCNRRLWALRELQRLKRKKDPDAIVDVKVKVRDILNETVKAVVEARAPAPILSARLRDGLKDEEDIQDDGFEALFQHADAPDRTEDVADRTEGGSGRPRKRQRIAPGED